MTSPIALFTDFGADDWYVGVMKGVILTVNPDARMIDVTHAIPPQDIEAGGFAVLVSCAYLPPESVVLVVVDPGVGGSRAIMCARSGGRLFVFPDNGVLTEVVDRDGLEMLVRVENRRFFRDPVSSTFHGRDIFAPVAAHLSLGLSPGDLGPEVDRFVRRRIGGPQAGEAYVKTRIRWIDGFGNLITDCPARLVREISERWGGVSLDLGTPGVAPLADTYEASERGSSFAIIGSSGFLEVSVREGSAAGKLDLHLGDTITLHRP
jgi:S-adenosylmethionine hydrolase